MRWRWDDRLQKKTLTRVDINSWKIPHTNSAKSPSSASLWSRLCKSEIKLKIWRALTTCCAKGSPASCWETVPTFITGFPSVTASAAKHYNRHHFLRRGFLSQPNGASCVSLLLVGHSFTPSRQQCYNESAAHIWRLAAGTHTSPTQSERVLMFRQPPNLLSLVWWRV